MNQWNSVILPVFVKCLNEKVHLFPGYDRYSPPSVGWCPWRSKSCTQALRRPGLMTVAIDQNASLALELSLSIDDNPDSEKYRIVLFLHADRVKIVRTNHGKEVILAETTNSSDVLHDYPGKTVTLN